MGEMVYKFRENYSAPVNAQIIGERLGALEREHGGVTPAAVVEDAKPEDSPLHPCFTWHDGEAAEKCRLAEARYLMNSVAVVVVKPNQDEVPEDKRETVMVKAFHNVRPEGEPRVYRNVAFVMEQPDVKAQVLGSLRSSMATYRRQLVELGEYAEIVAAMDVVLELASVA
jgi:hypothetical protein